MTSAPGSVLASSASGVLRFGVPLTASYDQCVVNARILIAFCRRLGLPFGINVESLTNRKVEIDASIDLARDTVSSRGSRGTADGAFGELDRAD